MKGQHLGTYRREVTHTKYEQGVGSVLVHDGTFDISVVVDVNMLVNVLGNRAARSKGGVAREASGLVEVRAKKVSA